MSGNVIPRTVLQAVGTNGLGRFIPQLQRVTLKFCKSRPDSRGVRDYIESHLVDFARANPSTVVYVKPRRHRPPLIVGEYLCGNWHYIKAAGMTSEEIYNWMEHLRTRSGLDILPIYKYWSTKSPSIQGMWHPFYSEDNPECRLLSPDEIVKNLDKLVTPDPDREFSAEDHLLQIAEMQSRRMH